MRRLLLLPLLALLLACNQPIENIARDGLAASHDVLSKLIVQYDDSCSADPEQDACQNITLAVHSHNLAVDTLEAYCAGDDFLNGGKCQPDKSLEPKLKLALQNLNRDVSAVKGLVK